MVLLSHEALLPLGQGAQALAALEQPALDVALWGACRRRRLHRRARASSGPCRGVLDLHAAAALHAPLARADAAVRVEYHGLDRGADCFERTARALGIMENIKAGVPRTAYHGVVMLRMGGRRVFIAPSYPVDQDITKRS